MNDNGIDRNTSVMHAAERIESVRPLSNDERRADWAAKYFLRGEHRNPRKPRIRVTVPQPLHDGTPAGAVHTSPERAQKSGNFNAGLRGDRAPPLPAAAARAGTFPIDKRELPNMSPEQWDEWERAFGPEPNIPEER